ncbi:MAG: TenA family transcriptional regulator [Acidobacteriota bacterium]
MSSSTRSPRRLGDAPSLQSVDVPTTPPPEDSISWKLWLGAQDLARDALQSDFVQGIANGSLDPNAYGHYSIQDVAYCVHGESDYAKTVERANAAGEPVLAAFAQARHDSYRSYTSSLLESWHLNNDQAVTPGPAARAYIDFEQMVASTLPPIYLIVAMIPCDQLWPWLAEQVGPKVKPGNVYAFWPKENGGWHGAYRLDNFVDRWFADHPDQHDEATATWVFRSCVTGEVNFFRSACGQSLLPMPQRPPSTPEA